MSKFPPGTYIIGAQKSGTTTLARRLSENPQICLSEPKEVNFYSVNYDKGLEWYKQSFSDIALELVDASTTYTMCSLSDESLSYKPGREQLQHIPRRIFELNNNAKFIYIVRDPVARMYSNYWHNVKYGYESLGFEEAITADKLYIEMSMYFAQLSKYLECFDKSRILVIKFEDLVKDQLSILNICEEFIGVSRSPELQIVKNENKGGQYNQLARILMQNRLTRNLDKLIPSAIKNMIKRKLTKSIPELDINTKRELLEYFKEDQKLLHESFGLSYI